MIYHMLLYDNSQQPLIDDDFFFWIDKNLKYFFVSQCVH